MLDERAAWNHEKYCEQENALLKYGADEQFVQLIASLRICDEQHRNRLHFDTVLFLHIR